MTDQSTHKQLSPPPLLTRPPIGVPEPQERKIFGVSESAPHKHELTTPITSANRSQVLAARRAAREAFMGIGPVTSPVHVETHTVHTEKQQTMSYDAPNAPQVFVEQKQRT